MALIRAAQTTAASGSVRREAGAPCTRRLRDSMRRFATGVTVVTTRAAGGHPVGLTVSSFNTVSLNPPLVLWSLSREARSLSTFLNATHFAVSVLGAHQVELADRFASSGVERFAGVRSIDGVSGVPILDDVAAWFECRNAFRHDGGDHVIFVGEVLRFSHRDHPPLISLGGDYVISVARPVRERTIARAATGLDE